MFLSFFNLVFVAKDMLLVGSWKYSKNSGIKTGSEITIYTKYPDDPVKLGHNGHG